MSQNGLGKNVQKNMCEKVQKRVKTRFEKTEKNRTELNRKMKVTFWTGLGISAPGPKWPPGDPGDPQIVWRTPFHVLRV